MESGITHLTSSQQLALWIPHVAQLDAKWFDWPWTLASWQGIEKDHQLTILEVEQQLVGFCLFQCPAHDEVAHLLKILILPTHRTRGLGKSLLLEAVRALPEHCHKLFLEVSERNQVAVNFYMDLGFDVLHQKKGFYSDGAAALILGLDRKDLSI